MLLLAWILRDVQGTGTSFKLLAIFVPLILLSLLLALLSVAYDCNEALKIIAYSGYLIIAALSVAMMLTVRQQSLENYESLPVLMCQIASVF